MPATSSPRDVVAILPVKPPGLGKSRLAGLSDEHRRALAAAFAHDTAAAVLATPGVVAVLAVTDDHRFAAELAETGCDVIPDGVVDDLNATLRQAAAEVARRWPGAVPVALPADLPGLRPHELAETLDALPADSAAFVRDASGHGTTLYAAPQGCFDPAFGPDSARAHLEGGAVELTVPAPSLRRDVDDVADLAAAMRLGLGSHTAALTSRLTDPTRHEGGPPSR